MKPPMTLPRIAKSDRIAVNRKCSGPTTDVRSRRSARRRRRRRRSMAMCQNTMPLLANSAGLPPKAAAATSALIPPGAFFAVVTAFLIVTTCADVQPVSCSSLGPPPPSYRESGLLSGGAWTLAGVARRARELVRVERSASGFDFSLATAVAIVGEVGVDFDPHRCEFGGDDQSRRATPSPREAEDEVRICCAAYLVPRGGQADFMGDDSDDGWSAAAEDGGGEEDETVNAAASHRDPPSLPRDDGGGEYGTQAAARGPGQYHLQRDQYSDARRQYPQGARQQQWNDPPYQQQQQQQTPWDQQPRQVQGYNHQTDGNAYDEADDEEPQQGQSRQRYGAAPPRSQQHRSRNHQHIPAGQYQQQGQSTAPGGRYPPPPNLPGYERPINGVSSPGRPPQNLPQYPSAVQHAHSSSSQQRYDGVYKVGEKKGEEEEDDWLPDGSGGGGAGIEGESGIDLGGMANDGGGRGGGMDMSQFDKEVIFSGLKRLYRKKIRPVELSSKYGHFHSPPLSPSDFDSKPLVLLVGQYSVGKTSFIRYLLGRDFPGQRIGPEPTTDRFVAIMKGESGDKIIPGAALCSQTDRPFRGMSNFGNNFLSRFEGVEMDGVSILNNITLIDTPGILSGQKQSIGRNYDYEQVMKWFAERADLIIIMFDAHKLDISDELKNVIELFKPHQDKMRVLLNKADTISTQQLMRVYGALMWSLGKVMMTPEVCRVYTGSFWGAPLKNKEQAELLTREKMDLFNDIAELPQNAVMRRINELVKRARAVKVHAYIIHYLRKQLPYTWGKREKQRRLIDRLEREFLMCARRYELPKGDFPELNPFRQALLEIKDLSEFPKLDKKMVKEMDKVFSVDIPNLLELAKYH